MPHAAPKPRRRLRRWCILLSALAVLVVGGCFLLTRGFVTKALAMGQIGALLGGEATAGSLVVDTSGRVIAEDFRLRARGVRGEAGVVFSAARIEADVDLWTLIRGRAVIHEIILTEPLVRLSQSIDDNTLNVSALTPREASGTRPREFPRVMVRGGVVELGEHVTDPSRLARGEAPFRSLRRIPVSGEVERAPGEQGEMRISFRELDPEGNPLAGPGGLQIQGRVAEDRVTLNLGVISLSTWPADSLPAPIRRAFRDLQLEGLVYGAELTYTNAGGVEARANLSDVAITLPVETQPDVDRDGNPLPQREEDKGRRLRMQRVHGQLTLANDRVRGDFRGLVEELPYEVTFQSGGAMATSAFECTVICRNFQMETRPQILRFAPGLVRRRLQQFSDPTGLVDVEVRLSRGEPEGGSAGRVSVAGVLRFRRATAAFERFPYRFTDMTGEFAFTEDRIEIRRVTGSSPAGATVEATGLISPLTDDAGVEVNVQVRNLPIDDTLARALQARGRIIGELCNAEAYEDLVSRGLIARPGQGRPGVPEFELGGRVDVLAVVRRVRGPEAVWHDTIAITMPRVGVLTRRAPYPLVARGVTIVKEDDSASIRGGDFEPPGGGRVRIEAVTSMRALDEDAPAEFAPRLSVQAERLAVDALLTRLLRAEGSASSIADSLEAMNPSGHADITASMGHDGQAGYSVEVRSSDLAVQPAGADGESPVGARRLSGTLTATPARVTLRAEGELHDAAGVARGAASIGLEIDRGADGRAVRTALRVSGADVAANLPLENFVRPWAQEAAAELAAVRAERAFEGVASAEVTFRREGESSDLACTILDSRDLSFLTPAGRVGLTSSSGSISLSRRDSGPVVAEFNDWKGGLSADGVPDGDLHAKGRIGTDGAPAGGDLALSLSGARFQSPLVRALSVRALPRSASVLDEYQPRGTFDLTATLTPRDNGWQARGVMLPRTLELRLGERDVALTAPSGRVEFSPTGGTMRDLAFRGEGWDASVRGGWLLPDSGESSAHAEVRLEAERDGTAVLSLLPKAVRDVFKEINLTVDGPLALDPLKLSITLVSPEADPVFSTSGTARVQGLSLEPGLSLTHGRGLIDFSAERPAPGQKATYELWGLLDSLTIGGVSMTQARVRLTGDADGSVLIPHFSADCHGGRCSAEGTVSPARDGPRAFSSSIQLAGVRFASLLADLTKDAPPDEATPPDGSRGLLDSNLTIAGHVNEPASRRGRGSGTISGGRVVSLPVIVPLVRVTNLELPINERLDHAHADFYIAGTQFNFESISLFSQSVEVFGFGSMQWPGTELDLRFRPRARRRIPLITPVLEGLRNELIAAQVQGTLKEPEVSFTTLGTTTRLIGSIFGATPSEQQRRLEAIERGALQRQDERHARPPAVEPR
jgi:Arc/MetJ family transcription regulator